MAQELKITDCYSPETIEKMKKGEIQLFEPDPNAPPELAEEWKKKFDIWLRGE